MNRKWIETQDFDWRPTKTMVGKIVRFGNGAIGTVVVPDVVKRVSPSLSDDVRVIQFVNPDGIIDFVFVEHLGFAEDYDMCYDYEEERTDPHVDNMMRVLNKQVEDGDKFKLLGQLFASLANVTGRTRYDDDVWDDFRKLFPADKRYV